MDSGFTLLAFPEDYNPVMLYVSYATGALHIEDEVEIRTASLMFDRLRTEALGPDDSVAFIEQVHAEIDK
jgi:hypothetical protein